jgi:hypothetical protein
MINASDALNNPLAIQTAILTDYMDRLEGNQVVVDANNSFNFLLEAFSQVVADATVATDDKLKGLYPIRAKTTKELFNHISDYEYVGFFSYPASLKMTIMLHRDYLVRNAVEVPDTNYQLVVIPADTVFSVGRFKFGLYYPINIKINKVIDTISASYDVTEINPLKNLATNSIEVKTNTYQGIDLVAIEFEAYQFDKVIYVESINPNIGFIKKYQHSNRFFAIRVFDTTSGEKKELNYSLSDGIYDINKPTINLKVYPESNEISIAVPQIYLTKGTVGTKLQVEIYTTIGEIDASLNNLQLSDITANFALNSPNTDLTYTNILKKIPTIIISPLASRVVGGANNLSFDEMKDYTIYHNNALSVPITRMDLDRFFTRNGFTYMAKVDNLTDRRYYAYRRLYLDNTDLGVANGNLTILHSEADSISGVLYQNNDTIVILPTVIFKYVPTVGKFEILDDATTNIIKNSYGNQLANLLNAANYYCNPHHIVISTLDRYPDCDIYDLFTVTTSNVIFVEENPYLSAQLSLINVIAKHINNGSGGYTIRIGIQRSEDLNNVTEDNFRCCLTATSKEGFRIGVIGSYVGQYNGLDIFDFSLSTNYKINGTRITLTNFKTVNADYPAEYEIELSGQMNIATFVKKSIFPNVNQSDTVLNYLTDDDGTWLGVSLQSFDYSLGSNLSDILDPNLLTNWTNVQYELYETNVPLTYEHDVYELNPDGTLKYTIDSVSNEVLLNKLHSVGEIVYDELGNIVYQHRVGDVVLDAGGTPIMKASRIKDFTIDISAYEYSHNVVINDFMINLSADLASYYDTIREMNKSVLENTDIYFKPIVTTNNGYYKVNNSVTIESSLELSFVFNCYVNQATIDDNNMITAIEDKIIAIVNSHLSDTLISLTEIAADIKSQLSSYINSIDTISLNGDSNVQTLMNIDVDKSPKLGMKLTVGRDGRLAYTPKITINFKPLDI